MNRLFCPVCARDDKLTVESRYGSNDYPYILNCPRCGQFEIDKLQELKGDEPPSIGKELIEKLNTACEKNYSKYKNG